jgi:MATE family multidrug resistance protein
MAAIFQIFDGVQVVILGALRGLADVKKAMMYAFFAYIVVNIPLSYFLTFVLGIGPVGIWIGFVAGLGIASVLFYNRFRVIYRRLK